jgi:hypothetical protein
MPASPAFRAARMAVSVALSVFGRPSFVPSATARALPKATTQGINAVAGSPVFAASTSILCEHPRCRGSGSQSSPQGTSRTRDVSQFQVNRWPGLFVLSAHGRSNVRCPNGHPFRFRRRTSGIVIPTFRICSQSVASGAHPHCLRPNTALPAGTWPPEGVPWPTPAVQPGTVMRASRNFAFEVEHIQAMDEALRPCAAGLSFRRSRETEHQSLSR